MVKWLGPLITLAVICLGTETVAFDEGCDPDAPIETRIKECSKILEDPSADANRLIVALLTRGLAQKERGDKLAAIEDFDRAVAIRPEDPQIRDYRGNLMLAFGNYSAAIEDFNWIIDRYPDAFGVFVSRCFARSEAGDQWGAIEDCESALRIESNLASAYNNMALALYRIGAHQSALSDIDVALSADAQNWALLDTRSHILVAVGKPKEAIAQFLKVIDIGGQVPTKLYQDALRDKGYYAGPSDGQLTDALRNAISNCVDDGCGLLAEAGVLPAIEPSGNNGDASQIFDTTYLCLAQAGLAEDSIFVSGGAAKTLFAADGSTVTIIIDSSGKKRVLARDARGLFAPDTTDTARDAVANCQ